MINLKKFALVISAVALVTALAAAQHDSSMDHANCPMNPKNSGKALPGTGHANCPMMDHFAGVDKRGDKAMGFSHDTTHHHFRLSEDGGAIQIFPNATSDAANRDAIRSHLRMIAGMFSSGNFSMPMFIHDTTVPGTQNMKRLKDEIIYSYKDLPEGGEILIQTRNPLATQAIHNFLRFQIKDHRTGDSPFVQES